MMATIILTLIFLFSDGSLFFGIYVVSWKNVFYMLATGRKRHIFFAGTMDSYKKVLDEESKNLGI